MRPAVLLRQIPPGAGLGYPQEQEAGVQPVWALGCGKSQQGPENGSDAVGEPC